MNQEQQRIEIAQVCFPQFPVFRNQHGELRHRYPFGDGPVADYLNSLDAMHAALKSQTQAFRAEFDRLLHAMAEEKHLLVTELEAKDWADALLRTLGLWETHPADG